MSICAHTHTHNGGRDTDNSGQGESLSPEATSASDGGCECVHTNTGECIRFKVSCGAGLSRQLWLHTGDSQTSSTLTPSAPRWYSALHYSADVNVGEMQTTPWHFIKNHSISQTSAVANSLSVENRSCSKIPLMVNTLMLLHTAHGWHCSHKHQTCLVIISCKTFTVHRYINIQ